MLLSDYIAQVRGLVHDSSSIDFSDADMTSYVNQARKRVALDFGAVRTYSPGCNTIAGQETYPIYGGVGGIRVTSGGTYAAPATVTIAAPGGGGTTATASVIMGGTAPNLFVQQVLMSNWGTGYTAPPVLTFSPGAPTATAVPVTLTNVFDMFQMASVNGLQRMKMNWRVFTEFDAFYRSNIILTGGQPSVFTGVFEQNLFYVYPIPDQSTYILERDDVCTPNPLVNVTDTDTQIIDPPADCVQFYAAHLALYKLQNFDQAEKMEAKYERRAKQVFKTRYAPRIPNPYITFWRRMQRGM